MGCGVVVDCRMWLLKNVCGQFTLEFGLNGGLLVMDNGCVEMNEQDEGRAVGWGMVDCGCGGGLGMGCGVVVIL